MFRFILLGLFLLGVLHIPQFTGGIGFTSVHGSGLIFACVLPLISTIVHHSISTISLAMNAALGTEELTLETSKRHQSVISTLRATISVGGVMGVLVGVIQMLMSMDDMASIGPYLATALSSALYSLVLSELWIAPLINRLQQRTIISETYV